VNNNKLNIICLLASGLSSRFGTQNKLLAVLNGEPMIAQTAKVACGAGFDKVYAVVNNDPDLHKVLAEFDIQLIINEQPEKGLSNAVKLAATTAIDINATSLTIALGDMPFITDEHLIKLKSFTKTAHAASSFNGQTNSPPALFGASLFGALTQLEGDRGALSLLNNINNLQLVQANPELLRDIDTPETLKAINMLKAYK